MALVVVVALFLVACAGTATPDGTAGDTTPTANVSPTSLAPGLPALPRVTVFGDSTALMSSWGMLVEYERTGRAEFVVGFTGLGCSVVRTPERRIADEVVRDDVTCEDWPNVWQGVLDDARPDVAVVQTGSWDVADRRVPGDDLWRGPGDPVYDAYAQSELLAAVDLLSAGGTAVVWLTSPIPGAAAYESPRVQVFDPAPRHERFNALVERLPALRPGKVEVVDLAGWVASQPPEEDARLRPDGVHFTHDASVDVCQRYLCDAVLVAARSLRPGPPPTGAASTTVPSSAPQLSVPRATEPDSRARARAVLVGQLLPDAGIAAARAGWRVRVDADDTFDSMPRTDDELVLWWRTGVVNDVR